MKALFAKGYVKLTCFQQIPDDQKGYVKLTCFQQIPDDHWHNFVYAHFLLLILSRESNVVTRNQGRNERGARESQFPGRRITAGGVENYQQCH